MKIPICHPPLDAQDIQNALAVLESGHLVGGRWVESIEKAVKEFIGVKYAVAVSSGTAALHLALLSLNIGLGDEVVVPAFSFAATANVVELVGARPVFVDIRPQDFNMDPSKIEKAITPRTKALMPVHEFGHPADMDRIAQIAESYDLPVVEDAACALGSEWKGRKAGSLGKIGAFSLHPRKAVTSGEGGILTTNDPDLASFFVRMRNHGIDSTGGTPNFVAAGYNYRMTDFQAALARGQITRLETIIEGRRFIADLYQKGLDSRYFKKPEPPLHGLANWQSYHILLNDNVKQSDFIHFLAEKEIGSNYGAQCIPVQTYYRRKYRYSHENFPEAYRAFSRGIVLPLFDSMSDHQISYVIETVNSFRS